MALNFRKGFGYHLDRLHDWWLIFVLRNKPYREYYRMVMKKETSRDPKYAVGGNWDKNGAAQLQRLVMHGLKPNNTLLDFGCGSLRGGIHLIEYLDKGNYWGLDISKEIIEAGKKFLSENGLEYKRPNLLLINNVEFQELTGKKFDFIHAQSVLSHMPESDIDELFKNLPNIMHDRSKAYVTFFESNNEESFPTVTRRNFFFPYSTMEKLANMNGLNIERAENVENLGKQKLVLLTLK